MNEYLVNILYNEQMVRNKLTINAFKSGYVFLIFVKEYSYLFLVRITRCSIFFKLIIFNFQK